MAFGWVCPFCQHAATIRDPDLSTNVHRVRQADEHGLLAIRTEVVVCPHPDCKKASIDAELYYWSSNIIEGRRRYFREESIKEWSLVPPATMKIIPDYVPGPIREDYEEACLIRDASPKAAATLARRALQGMIRDFWEIQRRTLKDEIDALEERVNPGTWEAIDAVRKIGNIGAHMERDINLIVEVEPEEAQLLIGLIETLIEDWYVVRHHREQRRLAIVAMAEEKEAQRRGAPAVAAGGAGEETASEGETG